MSVRRLSNGRWQARFSRQVNGRQKEVAHHAATEAEAKRWEREQQTKADGREYVEPSHMTLAAWFDEYLAGRVGIEGRTRADLSDVFGRYWRPTLGAVKLNKLTTEAIRRELRAMEAAEYSLRTIQQAHSILRQVLGGAVEAKRLGGNPAVASEMVPKKRRRKVQAWTRTEMRTFLDRRADDPLLAFYAIGMYAGMRPAEIVALTWRDVVLSDVEPHINVHRSFERARRGFAGGFKGTKTDRERIVPLVPRVVGLLRARRAVAQLVAGGRDIADDLIFSRANGQPLLADKVSDSFQAAITEAGVRRLTLYEATRHTAASLWIEAGVELAEVSKMLSHASIKLTADTYGHIRLKALHRSALVVAEYAEADETEAA